MCIYPPKHVPRSGAGRARATSLQRTSGRPCTCISAFGSRHAVTAVPTKCLSTARASPRAVHQLCTGLDDSMRPVCAVCGSPTSGCFTGSSTSAHGCPGHSKHRRVSIGAPPRRGAVLNYLLATTHTASQSADRRCRPTGSALAPAWGFCRLRYAAHSRCYHTKCSGAPCASRARGDDG